MKNIMLGCLAVLLMCTQTKNLYTLYPYKDILNVVTRCQPLIQGKDYEKECGKELTKFKESISKIRGFSTPLTAAAFAGNYQAVESLLKHGADINGTDAAGCTALHQAVHAGNENIVGLLLNNKAIPTIKSKSGETALDIAQAKVNLYGNEGQPVDKLSRAQRIAQGLT